METSVKIGMTLDRYCSSQTEPSSMVDRRDTHNGKIQDTGNTPNSEVAERLTDMGNNTRTKTKTDTANKISRKDKMLTNPEIRRWYDNLARGSEITAEVRLRRLDMFCRTHDTTAMELADL